jgi:formate hydrogenlyase subunit 6/NADH:ubiquinone oxidoreductase subunit I
MPDLTAQPEEKKKRKGTSLLAVMDENCSSCAGSPLCELPCPVENCINLLYEETPNGGLKPYRVWVDNDKLDKKICPWDAIKMYEFDEGTELSKYFYGPENIKVVNGYTL